MLASQGYLEKRGNSNTACFILCSDVYETYIRPVSKSKITQCSMLTIETLQTAQTSLHLSLVYTEIFPICDDSAVYRNTDSQETAVEHSKEAPLASKETGMQGVQHTKAFTSPGCAPACPQLASLSFRFLQDQQEEFCKSITAVNLPASEPSPTSLINYSRAI